MNAPRSTIQVMMDQTLRDIRFAIRTLWRSPGYTIFAVVTLGLGIGCNSAIFSVVNRMLLHPLPFDDPQSLVMIWQDRQTQGGTAKEWVDQADFLDFRRQATTAPTLAAIEGWTPLTQGPIANPLQGLRVTADAFEVMGVAPMLGRLFTSQDERPGTLPVLLLSHEHWQQEFGGASDVVGKTTILDGVSYSIVGVLPRGFRFVPLDGVSIRPEVWGVLTLGAAPTRGEYALRVIGRLADETDIATARVEFQRLASQLSDAFPNTNRGVGTTVEPLRTVVTGDIQPAMLTLLGSVGFVLLMACANVAHLLLARGALRRPEMALRTVLGAERTRLIRQLLTESLLLAVLGGIVGVFLAAWTLDLVIALLPPESGSLPLDEIGIDGWVLGFSLIVSLTTGFLFGILPSLNTARPNLGHLLRGRGSADQRHGRRVRQGLIVGEVAVAVVLLVNAGLLIRSFRQIAQSDRGFDPTNVWIAEYQFALDVQSPSRQIDALDDFAIALSATPYTTAATVASTVPMTGRDQARTVNDIADLRSETEAQKRAWVRTVGIEYFDLLHIPLHEGRPFLETDRLDAPTVAIVNEAYGRVHNSYQSPVGRTIEVEGRQVEIVGVVGDITELSSARPEHPAIYLSQRQNPQEAGFVVVRTNGEPEATSALRTQMLQLAPSITVGPVVALTQLAVDTMGRERFTMSLLTVFAVAALTLSAVGLYSVLDYSVAHRRHEIAVRMAVGATGREVRVSVVGHGITLALIGIGIGMLGALAVSGLTSAFLVGTTRMDPTVIGVVVLTFATTALLACYVPAKSATRVEPGTVLRQE